MAGEASISKKGKTMSDILRDIIERILKTRPTTLLVGAIGGGLS
jgi:hypothetical protein